jgi:hypothetical protein
MGSEPERHEPEPEAATDEVRADEEQRYIDDLIARGEAVPEGEELPPGATHEIVVDEHGRRTARRKRYSAY